MKFAFWGLSFFWFSFSSLANCTFPLAPDPGLTPGALCTTPSEYRYPEKIPYCQRKVSTATKRQIINKYDSTLGCKVGSMNRSDFKIDHYIPLCMGGSNDSSNLWPQHASIYIHTDQLEFECCQKMKEGKLTQKEAIDIIVHAKANLANCQQLLQDVRNMDISELTSPVF